MWRSIKIGVPTALAAILIWLGTAMNLIEDPTLLIWAGFVCLLIPIFLLNKEISDARNAKPMIKLKNFGFDIKEWRDSRPSVCAYIEVNNEPNKDSLGDVNSKGVYPTLMWVDEHGDVVDKNNGRWMIPNEDQEGAIPQLTVDLDANGLPRKLHFTYSVMQNIGLQSLWREGNTINTKMRLGARYDITIHLKDRAASEANFYFRIMPVPTEAWPNYSLRLERLDKKNGNIVEVRKFDLFELHRFEKEQGYVK